MGIMAERSQQLKGLGWKQKTGLLCALSGIVSGVVSGLLPQIGAPLFPDPWLPLVFAALGVAPGILFGLCFALAQARGVRQALLCVLGSTICCVVAGLVFGLLLALWQQGDFLAAAHFPVLAGAGALAGLMGAWGLMVVHQLLFKSQPRRADTVRTLLLGAGLGVIFTAVSYMGLLYVALLGESTYSVLMTAWVIGFVAWQVPVGLSLGAIPRPEPAA